MDPYRGFHRRFPSKRQDLSGALGGLVPPGSTSSTAKQGTTASVASQSPGNVGAIFTSLVGDVPTLILPSSGPSSTTTSSTPLTNLPSSSTGSTTASTSSLQTTTSTSLTTSTSSSTTSTTPTPTPTPSASEIVYTSSDGTNVVYVTSTLPAASATAAPPTSFLQNPSLEAGVFTVVGIVVLIIVFIAITWALRKRRRDRLERDLAAAVTFDPVTDHYEREENSIEKHRLSGSSSGHGRGYGMQPAYAPQQEYRGPMGYGQYPAAAYHTSSNPAPYQAPSPTPPQPAAQGGANLTRKFSDRKPVPPLLPDPAYNPSNTHVSIPPQFYQQ